MSRVDLGARALFEQQQKRSTQTFGEISNMLGWDQISEDAKEAWRQQARVVLEAAAPAMHRQIQALQGDRCKLERLCLALLRRVAPDAGHGVIIHAAELTDEYESLFRIGEAIDTRSGDTRIWLQSVPATQSHPGS